MNANGVRSWRGPRWLAIAALSLTLLLALHGVRHQELVASDAPEVASPSQNGVARSNPISLEPGRYRARVVIARETPPSRPASPASEIARIGLLPEGVLDGSETLALRPLDFIRRDVRVIHFTFSVPSNSRRCWAWIETGGPSGLRVTRAEVLRERPLWEWPGGATGFARAPARGLLVGLVWLVLLASATLLASRRWRARASADTAPGVAALHPATLTLLGLLAYVLAGLALFAALQGGSTGAAADGSVGCRWLPQLDPELAPLPHAFLVVLGAAAAVLLGWVLRRAPALVCAVPLAMLGLRYAGTLIGPKSDFQVYYNAGLALWAGADPYAMRPERVLNPPPFVLACSALPLLSLPTAGFFWFGLKAAAAAWCVPLARMGLVSGSARRSRWWLSPEWLGLLAAARLIGMDLQFGNTNVLVLLALLAAAAAWAIGNRLGAGTALAAGVALKATPAVAILGTGLGGRVRWAAGLTLISLGVLALCAAGLEWRAHGAGWGFVREAIPRPDDLSLGRVDNQSLRGFTDRMIGGADVVTKTVRSVPSLRLGARASRVVERLLDAAVLGALFLLARRARRAGLPAGEGRHAWATLWAGATLAILLLSPGSWTVHFALLYLPLVVLAQRMVQGSRIAGAAFLALAVVIILPGTSRALSDHFTALSSLTLASLAALAALLGREVGQRPGGFDSPAGFAASAGSRPTATRV